LQTSSLGQIFDAQSYDAEYFHLVQGRATITPVTVTGKPLGDDVQFEEGDYGVVPGGSYRWTAQKQVTKQTSCREGLQVRPNQSNDSVGRVGDPFAISDDMVSMRRWPQRGGGRSHHWRR